MECIKKEFKAWDYTEYDKFEISEYKFIQNNDNWDVLRNSKLIFSLPINGYELAETLVCGICSTDINRRFLPFPLPQVIGHEIIGKINGKKCCFEITDNCLAHNSKDVDIFCSFGLSKHCPGGYCLGINTLLGGFSPFILVPKNSIIYYNDQILDDNIAAFIEPLAAAYHAVNSVSIKKGDKILVIGPKKLGALLILALKFSGLENVEITSLIKRKEMTIFCKNIGSDFVLINDSDFSNDKNDINKNIVTPMYDIVFDTSGSEEGLIQGLNYCKKEFHLKSTNGKTMCGLKNLTAFVVAEMNIMKFEESNIINIKSYLSSKDSTIIAYMFNKNEKSKLLLEKYNIKVFDENNKSDFYNRVPLYDIVICSSLNEVDNAIYDLNLKKSVVRPKGIIMVDLNLEKCVENQNEKQTFESEIFKFLNRGGSITSSRCGDFKKAIDLLEKNSEMREIIKSNLITGIYNIKDLPIAFDKAKERESIKILVNQNESK